MSRLILIPEGLEAKLKGLTSFKEELNGIIFHKMQGNACITSPRIYLTGRGSSGKVRMDPDRLDVVNEFLHQNLGYGYIKFHTHTKGTIQDFGEYFTNHFSQQDIEANEDMISKDIDFIGMLITPTNILVYGRDNPQIKIYSQLDGVKLSNYPSNVPQGIELAQRKIEQRLGRRLGNFTLHQI